MTGNVLKVIAMFSMLVDYVGAIFFPDVLVLRVIGQLSLPIFAFLVAEGCYYTHDIFIYFLRLFAFASVSQLFYYWAFDVSFDFFSVFNVFFTLSLAVFVIYQIQSLSARYSFAPRRLDSVIFVIVSLIFILAASLMRFACGAYGILLVLAFYYGRKNRKKSFLTFAVLTTFQGVFAPIQILSLLAYIPLSKYNGKRGNLVPKRFFYAFSSFFLASLAVLRIVFSVFPS